MIIEKKYFWNGQKFKTFRKSYKLKVSKRLNEFHIGALYFGVYTTKIQLANSNRINEL